MLLNIFLNSSKPTFKGAGADQNRTGSQHCREHGGGLFVLFLAKFRPREIFKFVFCENFLEFSEISRNTKSKFGRNFRNFAKHKINIFGYIFLFF